MKSTATLLAASALAPRAQAADSKSVDDLLAKIQGADVAVRGAAWQGAATIGAPAVQPLGALMSHPDFEIARSAKRALYRIVRRAGRPGASAEARAVTAELIPLLSHKTLLVRREALWMLSEIGGEEAIAPMSLLLADADAREDARCALARIPGPKVTAALASAFATAPEVFKFALADSLRERGEKVSGYPTRKLIPTRDTRVKPLKAA